MYGMVSKKYSILLYCTLQLARFKENIKCNILNKWNVYICLYVHYISNTSIQLEMKNMPFPIHDQKLF